MAEIVTFESIAAGNPLTTAEPNIDAVVGTVNVVADSGVAGTRAIEFPFNEAGGNSAIQDFAGTPLGNIYTRFYFKVVGSLPGARSWVAGFRYWNDPTLETIAEIQINTNGTLRIRNQNTLVDTSTTVLSVDTWYRIEWNINRTGGTQELRLYSLHNTTPLETLTGACTLSTATQGTRMVWGAFAASGGSGSARIDEAGWDATTWIGPVGGGGDTEDPVAVVSLTAKDATYNSSDTLTSCTFDVTAAASTDNVGVTGYSWSDNGAGGSFSSTTVAAPTWTPPDLVSGPWTLTCTVSDAASNTNAAGVVVDVPTSGGGASPVAGIAIAATGAAI